MNTETIYDMHSDETIAKLNALRTSRTLGDLQYRNQKATSRRNHKETDKRIRELDGVSKQALQPRETLFEQMTNFILNVIIAILNTIMAILGISARIPYFGQGEVTPEGLAPFGSESVDDFEIGYDDVDASLRHHISPKPGQVSRSSAAAIKTYARQTREGLDVSPAILARIAPLDRKILDKMSNAELNVLSLARHDDIKAHFSGKKEMVELAEAREIERRLELDEERSFKAKAPIVPAWRKGQEDDDSIFSLDDYRKERLSQLAFG